MYQLLRPSKKVDAENGFSLLEVMVAMIVLTVGLMSGAMLMTHVYKLTSVSRYMALAAQLASEELEDLNRYPNNTNAPYIDPHIAVPAGSNTCGIPGEACVGSLTQDSPPVTIAGTSVSYYDSVSLASQSGSGQQYGQMSETYQMPCTGPPDGNGNFVMIPYSPNGAPPVSFNPGNPNNVQQFPALCYASAQTGMTFDRRWVIEQDQPVVGLRRITVLVTLDDKSVQMYIAPPGPGQQPPPSITFQMSMVRQ
jgi:prepilin-type N-terminal cleavage/methylation domain-containing protein